MKHGLVLEFLRSNEIFKIWSEKLTGQQARQHTSGRHSDQISRSALRDGATKNSLCVNHMNFLKRLFRLWLSAIHPISHSVFVSKKHFQSVQKGHRALFSFSIKFHWKRSNNIIASNHLIRQLPPWNGIIDCGCNLWFTWEQQTWNQRFTFITISSFSRQISSFFTCWDPGPVTAL